MNDLYLSRKLSLGYPQLDDLANEWFPPHLSAKSSDEPRVKKLFGYLERLIELSVNSNIVVIGCGPRPQIIKLLMEKYTNVVGVEPIPSFVNAALEYLNVPNAVLRGAAESIPLKDNSQNLVLLESVLEHVESPSKCLDEIFRVLAPGGILVISTTNRYRISLKGDNGEFNIPFFNWLPNIVKECFVFHHLHYDPSLANYTERPAVHWFSYADLCKLGRYAGFAHFYSILDLVQKNSPSISKSKLRLFLLDKLKFNPWLRAIVLTQIGGTIVMFKRHSDGLEK